MSYRVLVVDDEQDVRETLRGLLTLKGYEVVTAGDGIAAVASVRKYKPDMMILDVSMPRMSGFQTCQAIRRLKGCEDIPVILLTAKTSDADKKYGERLGAERYVTKPYHPHELMHIIEEVLHENAHPDRPREQLDSIDRNADWVD